MKINNKFGLALEKETTKHHKTLPSEFDKRLEELKKGCNHSDDFMFHKCGDLIDNEIILCTECKIKIRFIEEGRELTAKEIFKELEDWVWNESGDKDFINQLKKKYLKVSKGGLEWIGNRRRKE